MLSLLFLLLFIGDRGVGDEDFQNEEDIHTFNDAARDTTFTQSKRMYYYEGSVLPIEWTNQHGCGGNTKLQCEVVIQYACEDTLDPRVDDFWPWVTGKAGVGSTYRGTQHFRATSATSNDGATHIGAPRDGVPRDSTDAATDTIPDNEASAIASTKETRRFGQQESYDYYQVCQHTERQKGLYTADQRLRRNDQRGTRQNPNGNRHGFECPEERDYYPWWAPSPWIDIAVLSDSAGNDPCYINSPNCTLRCNYYMANTMNFNKRGYCDVDHVTGDVDTKINSAAWRNRVWYNNPEACTAAGFVWYEISHSDNLVLPNNSFVCAHTQYTRANHLGNGRDDSIVSQNEETSAVGSLAKKAVEGINAQRFIWTVPKLPTMSPAYASDPSSYFSSMENAYKSCVIRMRYNISTADFQQWGDAANIPGTPRMVDSANNSHSVDDPNTPLHQNPYVYIGPGDTPHTGDQFVSLRVNTNQFGRTFQDRSYVFSIRPLPTENAPASNYADSPAINVTAIQQAISRGGQIFNVNVRGKRGNIVQAYPAVEYDFVPDAVALGTDDMIHFQWTGSDYNPRRGCNNAEGGPPDANTFSTSANANLNSRADRSNLVFMNYEGNNQPRDYLGYNLNNDTMTYEQKVALHRDMVLSFAPCYDPATDSEATADECYNTVMRMAYLNQQSDFGSLKLRADEKCLTEAELNEITLGSGEDTAKNHPLNCAKMNAKPFPYFDGGVMFMRKSGFFPFFSSRNNNFSNRQQGGLICIGANCTIDAATGVLADTNPMFENGNAFVTSVSRSSAGVCVDTANSPTGSNANGATSCIFINNESVAAAANNILTTESFTRQEQDSDATGDGEPLGCMILFFTTGNIAGSVEQQVVLAVVLLAIGIFASWLAFYIYNRYRARRDAEPRFRSSTSWQGKTTSSSSSGSGGFMEMFSFSSDGGAGKKMPHMAKEII